MEVKDVEVTCPCCGTRLTVDARTRKILRSRPPKETDEAGKPVVGEKDWDRISSRVEGRLGAAASKFEENLSKERTKEKDLEDLFKKASEKIKKKEDDEPES